MSTTTAHARGEHRVRARRLAGAMLAMAVLAAGCGVNRAYTRGEQAARARNWDEAVAYFRQATQNDPDRPEYKIALERAMASAAIAHAERARALEAEGRIDDALREYRKASEFDPSNRSIAARASDLERTLRDQIEAQRPRPQIDQMREQIRRSTQEPILSPTSREPLNLRFTNAGIRDVLSFIGNATGINVTYDRDFQDRQITVQLDGVTLEQALQQLMVANQIFYKVLNPRTILVAADTTQKRQLYEEQVIRTFYVSHADATELATLVNTVIRVPQMAVQPMIAANKTSNTITVRASTSVAEIIERIIESNDKPRAEVIIDVQILEVSRERAKRYGVNLTDYALGTVFSPEVRPGGTSAASTTGTGTGVTGSTSASAGGGVTPGSVGSPPEFNANTISNGISAADFWLAIPAAVVRFLESDSQTKVVAKPQLRGTEGQKVTLNLGEEVPVPSTTFTPIATGGANTNPLVSFTYRPVGVIVEMTPRVTYEGEVIMDLTVESSNRGRDTNIAGQNLPSFGSRKVTTRLRLRDGESNLLAGLLREDERKSLRGFPGLLRVPVLQQLFADNDGNIQQTDIVMLLTPRIVRSHNLTTSDLSPIYVGTQGNMAIGGAPPVFGGAEPPPGAASAPGGAGDGAAGSMASPAAAPARPAGGAAPFGPVAPGSLQVPAGSSPVPGTTAVPMAPATPPPGVVSFGPPAAAAGTPAEGPARDPSQAAAPATTPNAPFRVTTPPAMVTLTLPDTEMRVGGGPYTVPVAVTNASRLSTVTLSITYNPAVLRVRSVQEGSFMRQGGAAVAFTQQVDAARGRLDMTLTRTGDRAGAAGTGLLAAVLFDVVAAGTSPVGANGVGTVPGGGAAALQFAPLSVTVK